MDQDIEILPSSSAAPSSQRLPMAAAFGRPASGPLRFGQGSIPPMPPPGGRGVHYGNRLQLHAPLPPRHGAGAPPPMLRIDRQLPTSFQRTAHYYDGAPRQTSYSGQQQSGSRVVLVPRAAANGGSAQMMHQNESGQRFIQRGSVDTSANKYVVLPNGQLSRVPQSSRVQTRMIPTPASTRANTCAIPAAASRSFALQNLRSVAQQQQQQQQFAFDEAEDREINEAIAQQEELMRLEADDGFTNHYQRQGQQQQHQQSFPQQRVRPPYSQQQQQQHQQQQQLRYADREAHLSQYGEREDVSRQVVRNLNAPTTGFRRVDYATTRAAISRRPGDERILGAEDDFANDGAQQAGVRGRVRYPPQMHRHALIPAGSGPGGGYRVAPCAYPLTRLRPVNPRRIASTQKSAATPATQIQPDDTPDTRICKSVLRDIIDEICVNEQPRRRPENSANSLSLDATHGDHHNYSIKQEIKEEINELLRGRTTESSFAAARQSRPLFTAGQDRLKSTLQRKFGDDFTSEDVSAAVMFRSQVRARVTSPVGRQIVGMRDNGNWSFEQIASHLKLEPSSVRMAYAEHKKQGFRGVGRPRKSESEDRKFEIMPLVTSGRMPPATNDLGIPSPAAPLPARYTSCELSSFLDVFRHEVTKRRVALEKRAEEETGIVMPWYRTRSKSVKTIKRQTVKKEGAATNAESFSLCDPRYISLGGNTVPLEEMPMRMELDLSGNAKITTNSEMMQNAAASAAAAAAHEENDESDEADENRAARKTASGDGDGNGNDESENDDSTDDERSEGGADMSLDEEAQNGDALLANGAALGGGNASSQKPRMAKFASLTKTGLKKEMAGVGRLESKRERTKREAEKRKAQKKEEKLKLKLQKKRNVSQQRRRDRERRVHMIHMRKMMKNGAAPPPNPLSSDDNGAEDEHETVKTYSRMARIGATTPLVKKSSVVGSAAVLKRKTIAQKSDASADAAAKDSGPAKYCPCGGSYDAKKFYISCDECSRWYHGKCAGVTEKRAAKLAEEAKSGAGWTCADCEKARTQSSAEVYCVCRRPYDDAKFYVGCDSCEDWFHPECIGTTQAEVSKLDTFLCPKCRESEDI